MPPRGAQLKRLASPVERVAYSPDEASASIGCSRDFFDDHIGPELRWIRRGRRKFVAVDELRRWCDENAARALGEAA